MSRLIEDIVRLEYERAGDLILEPETAFVNRGGNQVGVDCANEELANLGRVGDIDRREEVGRITILQKERGSGCGLRILLSVYEKWGIQR